MPIDEQLTKVFISIRSGLARAVSGIVPPKEIEDVVQETYVRVCQIRSDTEIKSPRSFMYKTARNIALNHVNCAESRLSSSLDQMNSSVLGDMQDPYGDTLRKVCSDEEFSLFCDAVRSLPVQCRRAFVLTTRNPDETLSFYNGIPVAGIYFRSGATARRSQA